MGSSHLVRYGAALAEIAGSAERLDAASEGGPPGSHYKKRTSGAPDSLVRGAPTATGRQGGPIERPRFETGPGDRAGWFPSAHGLRRCAGAKLVKTAAWI